MGIHKFVDGTRAFTFDDVTCEVDELHHDILSVSILCVIIVLLLMSDLARDVVGCMHVMFPNFLRQRSGVHPHCASYVNCCSLFVAVIIFVESVLACSAAIMFSLASMREGNSADAIMNCVAVLFLHEVDEKLFPLLEQFRTDKKLKASVLCCLFRVWRSAIVFLCASSDGVLPTSCVVNVCHIIEL